MSTLSIPSPQTLSLSFSRVLGVQTTTTTRLFLHHSFVDSKLTPIIHKNTTTIIRMGGGPRTYPGGVSKWQWKRMQAKKTKQLLKARLARERHIYEMRKRAELKAAVSELEKPWEPSSSSSSVLRRVHAAAPTLFSVSADEQLKVLADRFQKPGGFDLWSPRDGPQLFRNPKDNHHHHLGGGGQGGASPPRFFPKGIVHIPNPVRQLPPPAAAGAGSDADVDVDVDVVSAAVSAEPETPRWHKKTSQPQPELRSNFDSEQRRRGGGVDRWIRKGGVPRSPNASLEF